MKHQYDVRLDFTIEAANKKDAKDIFSRLELTDPADPDDEILLDSEDGLMSLGDGEYDGRLNFILSVPAQDDENKSYAVAKARLETMQLCDPKTGEEYPFDTSEALQFFDEVGDDE